MNYENSSNKTWKSLLPSPKRLLTAPFLIAFIIGMFFFATGLRAPLLFTKTVSYIAGLNTPLAMFTIGIYLAQTDVKKMFGRLELYKLSMIRLLMIPLLSIPVLMMLPEHYADMRLALLIVAACPAGSNVAVYAHLYDNDYSVAVESVVISTLLSIVTLPLVVYIAGTTGTII